MNAPATAVGRLAARWPLLVAGSLRWLTRPARCCRYAPTAAARRRPTAAPTAGAAPTAPASLRQRRWPPTRPRGDCPTPGDMPAGSTMRKIQDRGRLIAGVSADTYLLGSRNPLNGKIEGFDIDMVKAVAKAIFGDENKYELRVITAAAPDPGAAERRRSTSSPAT